MNLKQRQIFSSLEDEESRFIFENRLLYNENDIEGSELEALKGCQNIIKQYRLKLAISVYHMKKDIIEIPEYIMNLVSDYHFYLRHYSSSFSETVLYALP